MRIVEARDQIVAAKVQARVAQCVIEHDLNMRDRTAMHVSAGAWHRWITFHSHARPKESVHLVELKALLDKPNDVDDHFPGKRVSCS